ncbi:hypothetical protein ACLKA7_005407 [Drosophila subpalustris]
MRQAKAAEMKSFMNENIEPCQNFYEFACGKWARINKANGEHLTTGVFERLSNALERKMKQTLNNEDKEHDTAEDRQVRDFYKSCIRVTSIDDEYRNELKSLIEMFGTMPVLEGDSWNESDFDWLNTTAHISLHYGLNIILGTEVLKDLVDNQVNVVYIEEQDFPLESRSMYLDDKTADYRKLYAEIMASKLMAYLNVEEKLALKTARELMHLEVQLANGLLSESDDVPLIEIAKQTTLEEMQRKYAPTINVKHLVDISVSEGVQNVYDFNPDYKINLVKVLQKTSKRILANYIFYRLIDKFTFHLGNTQAKREENCLTETKRYFSKNLDNMIYRRYNNNEATISDVELIWSELKETFKMKLQSDRSLNWITNRTRDVAIKKLAAMKLQINSYADEDLSEDFKGIHLQDENYIDNLKNVLRKGASMARELLNKPAKPLEAGEVLSFTPANILLENMIKVPVALLQPYYLWASSYPNAIKFGTLASLIGHELIHGFDTQGRRFDAIGNINDWWDEESTLNFENRKQCFMDQYSRYSYNGLLLPASNEQSENIADNGGIRLAFTAYRRWLDTLESSGIDVNVAGREQLPTLNYTNMQLFFISYAQIWCNDVDRGYRNLQVATDQHVPGQYRVIGPLSNFPEFAKEFHCAPGTRMNPATKCQLY